jgi:hypothetical protein
MTYSSISPDGSVRVDFSVEELRFDEWERPTITLTGSGEVLLDAPRDWHGKVRWQGDRGRFELEVFRIGKRGHVTAEVHLLEGRWRILPEPAWRPLEELEWGLRERLDSGQL